MAGAVFVCGKLIETSKMRLPGMAWNQQQTSSSAPYWMARGAAVIAILFALTIFAGWWFQVGTLQRLWPGLPRIPPNGALVSLLLGVGLWSKVSRSRIASVAGTIAVLIVAGFGGVTLLEYLLAWQAPLDQWLFRDQLLATQGTFAGRLSFPAALGVLCLGLAVALLDVRIKGIWVAQVFIVIALLVALLALVGHLSKVPEFYGKLSGKRQSGMPLQATLGLLLLGAGLLCARPGRGLMAILWSYTPGGMLGRWLLLAPAVGLLLTGVVYLLLGRLGSIDRGVRTWALGLADLFFVTIPIWAAAQALHRAGLERDRAHHELEERVRQRTAELSSANAALLQARDRLEEQAAVLEQRVQERTAKLAESVGDLEAFAYSVAHDMRAPLRGMQGFARLLLDEHAAKLDADGRDYLERIANSATRMDLLIQDALDYTQVLQSETELKPVDLDKVVRQLVSNFPGWQPPHAQIEVADRLAVVLAHESLLAQCLSNLIGNAVKFVAPGVVPRVRIWAETMGNYIRVFIQDNGIGIAAAEHDRIFRMFERLNRADEYEGTGIGLAIVRKAVERMQGRVDYESEPGHGAKFWVELRAPAKLS